MMEVSFPASRGRDIVEAMVKVIDDHAAALSEIDGAIGDGDHGVNMRKGFLLARDLLPAEADLSTALATVSDVLLTQIGGAMGPLYGSFFEAMAAASADAETVNAGVVGRMLDAGRLAIEDVGGAQVGDKTLLDSLVPGVEAFHQSVASGGDLPTALDAMVAAAEAGKESTRELVARVGRAARLGDRSRGVLDAGATSCWLLLGAMASSMTALMASPD